MLDEKGLACLLWGGGTYPPKLLHQTTAVQFRRHSGKNPFLTLDPDDCPKGIYLGKLQGSKSCLGGFWIFRKFH